jgi:phage gp29-like protein
MFWKKKTPKENQKKQTSRATPISNRSEIPVNFANLTVDSVASVIHQSEQGNSAPFWRTCRTIILHDAHIQAEMFKRKNAVLGDELTVIPWSTDAKDVEAAEAAEAMLTNLPSLQDALIHLMDATIYPLSIVEKVFGPADPARPELGRRTALAELVAVPYRLIAWDKDGQPVVTDRENIGGFLDVPPIDPAHYVVHRGHMLTAPDRYGGPMRAIFFLVLLSAMGTTWWARYLERYGSPFIVGRVDSEDDNDRRILEAAISYANQIGGLVVSGASQIELKESSGSSAQNFENFKAHCRREISRIVLGQTLSSEASPTGIGSGASDLQGEVKDDIKKFDSRILGETIRTQIVAQWLTLNGYAGRPPTIIFSGDANKDVERAITGVKNLYDAGLEPTDEALAKITEIVGYGVQRRTAPPSFSPFSASAFAAGQEAGGSPFFRREVYKG